jgi:hypothetical protein
MTNRGPDAGTTTHLPQMRRRLARILQIAAAVPLVFALLAVLSPAAWAHEGNATISCSKVAFYYLDFPNQPGNTIHETVIIDGVKTYTGSFSFNGPSGSNSVRLVIVGAASVEAKARWNTNDVQGSFAVTQELMGCGGVGGPAPRT